MSIPSDIAIAQAATLRRIAKGLVKHVVQAAVTEVVVPHQAPGADAKQPSSRRKKRAAAAPAKKKTSRKKAARQPSDV